MTNTSYFISSNVCLSSPASPMLLSYADPGQYGVLAPHIAERRSMEEINAIVSELLERQPYLSGIPCLEVTVMQDDGNSCTALHNLRFHNPDAVNQPRASASIQFAH